MPLIEEKVQIESRWRVGHQFRITTVTTLLMQEHQKGLYMVLLEAEYLLEG